MAQTKRALLVQDEDVDVAPLGDDGCGTPVDGVDGGGSDCRYAQPPSGLTGSEKEAFEEVRSRSVAFLGVQQPADDVGVDMLVLPEVVLDDLHEVEVGQFLLFLFFYQFTQAPQVGKVGKVGQGLTPGGGVIRELLLEFLQILLEPLYLLESSGGVVVYRLHIQCRFPWVGARGCDYSRLRLASSRAVWAASSERTVMPAKSCGLSLGYTAVLQVPRSLEVEPLGGWCLCERNAMVAVWPRKNQNTVAAGAELVVFDEIRRAESHGEALVGEQTTSSPCRGRMVRGN